MIATHQLKLLKPGMPLGGSPVEVLQIYTITRLPSLVGQPFAPAARVSDFRIRGVPLHTGTGNPC
jgi:hypothetical protein